MNIETIKSVYFVGAGGIGMSALVRYFLFKGKVVAGYDRTPTPLTETLIAEGAQIHYEENIDLIPEACKDKESTLVVFTPAVPQEHEELVYFRNNGFEIQKRAQVLGTITHSSKGLCVAGTHGKTTTSTMTAHLLHQSHVECTAFLGGISKNYGTNLLLSQKSPYTVIEADEFDRSFHWLSPYMSVITATDPDHLDIYGTEQAYLESFFVENFGDKFQQLKEAVREAIRQIYGNIYTGYLGVDMLVYRRKTNGEFAIHPCIEVNMRYTMGMVALRISQKYLAPNARGDMRITYTNKPGEAYEQHCFMKKAYPLEMKDGKIREGYISLCPVTRETKYRAYILVF